MPGSEDSTGPSADGQKLAGKILLGAYLIKLSIKDSDRDNTVESLLPGMNHCAIKTKSKNAQAYFFYSNFIL